MKVLAGFALLGAGFLVTGNPETPQIEVSGASATSTTLVTTPKLEYNAPSQAQSSSSSVAVATLPPTVQTLPPPTRPKPIFGPGSYVVGTNLPPGNYVIRSVADGGCWLEAPLESTPDRGSLSWATTLANVGPGATFSIPSGAKGFSVLAGSGCLEFSQ